MPYVIKSIEGQEPDQEKILPENGIQNRQGKYRVKEVPESELKSSIRMAAQPVKGAAYYAGGVPAAVAEWNKFAAMEDLEPEERLALSQMNPEMDWAKFEKEYAQGQVGAMRYSPSISGLANALEEMGVPTEAKTSGQKLLETASLAGGGVGGISGKAAAAEKAMEATKAGTIAGTLFQSYKNLGLDDDQAQAFAIGFAGLANLMTGKGTGKPVTVKQQKPVEPAIELPTKTPIHEFSEEIKEGLKEGSRTPTQRAYESTLAKSELGQATKSEQRLEKPVKFVKEKMLPSIKERFTPPEESLPKGERQLQIELAKLEKPKTGKVRAVEPVKERKISDIAKQKLELEGLELRQNVEKIDPIDRVGETISILTDKDKGNAGRAIRREIRDSERAVYDISSQNYEEAEKAFAYNLSTGHDAVPELESIYDKFSKSSDPVEKRLALEAKKLINEFVVDEEYVQVPVSKISDRIKEINSLRKNDFPNSSSNKFSLLTDILHKHILDSAGVSRTTQPGKGYMGPGLITGPIEGVSYGNSKAVIALQKADQFYKQNYAKYFKNPEIMNFLDNDFIRYSDHFTQLSNPDVYNFLEPILNKTPAGQRQLAVIKRNMIEKALEPLVQDKKGNFISGNYASRKINDALDSIGINITKEEKNAIYKTLKEMKTESEQSKLLAGREATKPGKPKKEVVEKPKERKYHPLEKEQWRTASEKATLEKANSITGLKQLKKVMKPEKYEDIAYKAGIRRIHESQRSGEELQKTVERLLANQDEIEYLKYSIGNKEIEKLEKFMKTASKKQKETFLSKIGRIGKKQFILMGIDYMSPIPVPIGISAEIAEGLVNKK